MNSTTSLALDPIPGVVAWIEPHLDQSLTLEQVAARAGLSPHHFSRLFTARMGRSVMAHVRGRRLVRGARRLCDEPELKLVDHMAGVGVESVCTPPPSFSAMEIPAATYAVVRITLNGTALHPQVKQAMASIWSELIPTAGLEVVEGPDFERYDGRFDPQKPGSFIDFHVPVKV